MKRMRTASLFLAFILTANLVYGCSKQKNSSSPSPDETQSQTESPSPSPEEGNTEKIKVEIFQFRPDLTEGLVEAVKEYTKENEEIEIKVEAPGEGQDYSAALRAKFNSNLAPAIFNIGSPKDIVEWKGKLLDVSGMEIAKNTIKGSLEGMTNEGKVLGLPYFIQGYGLIFNKKILEQAQIEIKDVETFTALEDMVKNLDKQKKELKIDAVFALPAKEKDSLGSFLSNLFIAPEFDNNIFKTFESKTIEFTYTNDFKKMLDLFNKFSVQPSTEIDYQSQVDYYFSTGKVAMILQGNWAYPSIELIDKELAQTGIGFMPFPLGETEETAIPVGVPMYWAFNNSKPEEVQKASKEFISWLYIAEGGKKIITEKLKFVPPYTGFSGETIKDPLGKYILNQASAGKTINWVFNAYPRGFAEKLATDIQQYLKGTLSWDEVIRNAETAWADARNE